jgi:hypothetical protein
MVSIANSANSIAANSARSPLLLALLLLRRQAH